MANKLPDSYKDIFSKKTFMHLATLTPEGSPHVSPVWVDLDGDQIVVNSAKGRFKDKNMRADPRVACSGTDPENPYRSVMVRGKVVKITEEGADEHIDKMARKYLGQEKYPNRQPGEVRVLYYIQPERVATMN